MPKSFLLSDEIHRYLLASSTPVEDRRRALIEETAELGRVAGMQVAPEQSLLLTMLTRLVGVRLAVEVGTFTGLSALSIAIGLAPGGRLLCCDINEDWTAVARRHWAEAGLADRIDLVIAPAAETIAALPAGTVVDLAFIDGDKPGYATYWDLLVPLLRPGGLLIVDNVLWAGKVIDPAVTDPDTEAIRAFNAKVAADPRMETVMLPVSDGLTLAWKQ